jgi:peroxiredoxin
VLHGFPDHPPTAKPFLAELGRRGRHVVAPWLRGYAPSPTAGPFDFASLTSDVLALIDRWSPGRAVELIGHDWGAFITYDACATAPERIKRAVTLAIPHPRTFLKQTSLAQLRRNWHMGLFQLPGSGWLATARNFALIDHLWRQWSPGLSLAPALQAELHKDLRASMPAPLKYGIRCHGRAPVSPMLRLLTMKHRPVAQTGPRAPSRGKALFKTERLHSRFETYAEASGRSGGSLDTREATKTRRQTMDGQKKSRQLAEGDRAPDFEFVTRDAQRLRSDELLRRGPVLLTFYRGAWCMCCQSDLRDLNRAMPEIRHAGATVLGVFHDLGPEGNDRVVSEYELDFPLVDDADGRAAEAFGVRRSLGEQALEDSELADLPLALREGGPWIAPMQARFLIAGNGTIVRSDVVFDYNQRTNARDMLPLLQRLSGSPLGR